MLTTESLVSIRHITADVLYPFHPSPTPFPSGNHYSVLCIYMFVFVCFIYLFYSTYEWNHTVFVFLRLTYFTEHNTLKIHPCF